MYEEQFTPETQAIRDKFTSAINKVKEARSLFLDLEKILEIENDTSAVKEIKNTLFLLKSCDFPMNRAFDNYRLILFKKFQNQKTIDGSHETKV